MYVPVEEEQNQTEAEQWIEQIVKKTRERGFFGKNSLHWEKWEVKPVKGYCEILDIVKEKESKQTQKRKQRRKSNGNGNRDRNEKKQRKINK